MPNLHGISGASVWGFMPKEGALWSAERQVKVVAIETGYLRETYVRAQSWAAVALVLS